MSVRPAVIALALALAAAPCTAAAAPENPLTFFAGRTESIGTVKIMTKKPFRSRAIGKGEIKADGSLDLIQRIEDGGQPRAIAAGACAGFRRAVMPGPCPKRRGR